MARRGAGVRCCAWRPSRGMGWGISRGGEGDGKGEAPRETKDKEESG